MIPIDTLTTYVMTGMLYLVLPLITWFALFRQRTRAVDLWCLGGILGGVGILLVGLRGNLPALLTYPVANSAIMLSFLLRVKSLHLDLDERGSTRLIIALYLLYIGPYLLFFLANQETWLSIWARLGMVLANAWLVGVLIKIARQEQSRNARAIAVIYGVVVIAFSVLLLMTVFGMSTLSMQLIGPEIQAVVFAASIASIVGHFSYMGLVLERSGRIRAAVAVDNARIEAVRLKNQELAVLDRRRSLGMITASLSHELSQPLTAVSLNTQIAQRALRQGELDPPAMNDLLTRIVFNINGASQVIEQIRGFVRPSTSQPHRFDMRQTVRQVLRLFRQDLFKQGVEIALDLPDETVMVDGDPIQISQVLLHAVRNAIEATQSMAVRKITIRLRLIDPAEAAPPGTGTTGDLGTRTAAKNLDTLNHHPAGRSAHATGDHSMDHAAHRGSSGGASTLVIEIRDNGPGLSEDTLAKVGTPFFSTKPGNLGLGLAISRQILSLHQGRLTVFNLPDGGACTRIQLPSSIQDAPDKAAPHTIDTVERQGLTNT